MPPHIDSVPVPSPLQHILYINELVTVLEQSATPSLTLQESDMKCLLFADDLVLLMSLNGTRGDGYLFMGSQPIVLLCVFFKVI